MAISPLLFRKISATRHPIIQMLRDVYPQKSKRAFTCCTKRFIEKRKTFSGNMKKSLVILTAICYYLSRFNRSGGEMAYTHA